MKGAQGQNVNPVQGIAQVGVVILDSLFEDYRHRETLNREEKKAQAVQVIVDAIFEGRRVKLTTIQDIVPGGMQMGRRELANRIGISSELFNAGVKRWYHF